MEIKYRVPSLILWAVAFCIIGLTPGISAADVQFQQWLSDFYPEAAKQGIARSTYEHAFAGITEPDQEVLKKAAYQPEFTQEVWDYLDTRVNPGSVTKGQQMAQTHLATLAILERKFGVERSVLLAIWSMESNYGAVLARKARLHYVPQALATLAYGDDRRRKFAKSQLIAALQILQEGDVTREQMLGSWAGAMGHTQFIPTSYLAYGVDLDGNGRRDIWNSIPDALATAANLLAKNGWRSGKTWGYETVTQADAHSYEGQTKTIAEWTALGFVRPAGKAFPRPRDKAVLKMPGGVQGPIFLMLKNFFVLKRYNNSDSYALAVGLLADRLAGHKGMVQRWPRPAGSLNIEEKFELQKLLKDNGHYPGKIDGYLGAGTRAAIREFQVGMGLVTDGRPTITLLETLRKNN